MGHPQPLFVYFRSLQTIKILQQINVKISTQYLALGFELTTFRLWVSSNKLPMTCFDSGPLVYEATAMPTEAQPTLPNTFS